MANPTPREVWKMLKRQRTPWIVFDKSYERRSRKNCQWSPPIICRANSSNICPGSGSPMVRSDPRVRNAAGSPASRCKSLAPLARAVAIIVSKSICNTVTSTGHEGKRRKCRCAVLFSNIDPFGPPPKMPPEALLYACKRQALEHHFCPHRKSRFSPGEGFFQASADQVPGAIPQVI